jgi:hypothetical protein
MQPKKRLENFDKDKCQNEWGHTKISSDMVTDFGVGTPDRLANSRTS